MRKLATEVKALPLGGKNGLSVHYYITVDEIPGIRNNDPFELYGICVETGQESSMIQGITPHQFQIEELAERLAGSLVTPAHLEDIVQDMLGIFL